MSDKVTLERIEKAHPKVREELGQIFVEINQRLTGRAKVRFTHVLRTFKEQDDLHRIGRRGVKGERIVTNARGGQSYHNFGLAADIALIIDGRTASWDTAADWDLDKIADWLECVQVFKKYGWEWGGDWKGLKDPPHFQKTFGKTTRQLLALRNAKKVDPEGYVLL